jgi:hypothetical protein
MGDVTEGVCSHGEDKIIGRTSGRRSRSILKPFDQRIARRENASSSHLGRLTPFALVLLSLKDGFFLSS